MQHICYTTPVKGSPLTHKGGRDPHVENHLFKGPWRLTSRAYTVNSFLSALTLYPSKKKLLLSSL